VSASLEAPLWPGTACTPWAALLPAPAAGGEGALKAAAALFLALRAPLSLVLPRAVASPPAAAVPDAAWQGGAVGKAAALIVALPRIHPARRAFPRTSVPPLPPHSLPPPPRLFPTTSAAALVGTSAKLRALLALLARLERAARGVAVAGAAASTSVVLLFVPPPAIPIVERAVLSRRHTLLDPPGSRPPRATLPGSRLAVALLAVGSDSPPLHPLCAGASAAIFYDTFDGAPLQLRRVGRLAKPPAAVYYLAHAAGAGAGGAHEPGLEEALLRVRCDEAARAATAADLAEGGGPQLVRALADVLRA